MRTSFLDDEQVVALGLLAHKTARISGKASFYGAEHIRIGAWSRIDDFCVLSAESEGFQIGAHVHVAAASLLIGRGRLEIDDFAGISGRVSVYTSSDDYSGAAMTNPTVPSEYSVVDTRPVRIGRHAIVGAGSVILPGVEIGEGAVVGALSLVTQSVAAWTKVAGTPARVIGERSRALIEKERAFLASRHLSDA